MTIDTETDYYVMQATGSITIPTAGNWTFCANTADGFSCTINGNNFQYNGLRSASDTLDTINFSNAGTYSISFMQFANTGNSSAEFSAVSGSVSAFNSSFRLVGDTADGGLQVTSPPFIGNSTSGVGNIASSIQTNIKSAVEQAIGDVGGPASLYVRMDFNAASYTTLSTLTLKMQCADGYVAYLNGVEVASYNAPGTVTWNSLALEQQTSQVQATTYQDVNLTSFLSSLTTGHLTATGDVLAIQVLMSSDTSAQMLVLPVLCQLSTVLGPPCVFTTPTPGTANALGDAEPSITFSTVHGFFYSTFQLDLTPNIPGTSIYYTTDNSAPAPPTARSTPGRSPSARRRSCRRRWSSTASRRPTRPRPTSSPPPW